MPHSSARTHEGNLLLELLPIDANDSRCTADIHNIFGATKQSRKGAAETLWFKL
jgi:hypothetical protein